MSSIIKGILREIEQVHVLYINGKPATKYVDKRKALKDITLLKKQTPNGKFELKDEMREDAASLLDPKTSLAQARQITKTIKYDDTVDDIVVKMQMLAEKTQGLDMKTLEYSMDAVRQASNNLELAVYGLEEAWEDAISNQDEEEIEEDSDMRYAAEVTPAVNPYGGDKDRQFRGAISEISDTKTNINQTGGFITPEHDNAYKTLKKVAPKLLYYIQNNAPVPLDPILTLELLIQMQGDEEEVLQKIKHELSKDTNAMYGDDYPTLAESVNSFWKKFITEMPDTSGPIGVQPGGWRKYRPKPAGEIEEDTAYGGGMGQGGNAGQSYRWFKPKVAGTFKEEQLDEKCWDGYKQVGGKEKNGKMVPNCVPKESIALEAKDTGFPYNYTSMKHAMSRVKKVPNSKIIKTDQGFAVVDKSDPNPEIKPDLNVLQDYADLRKIYWEVREEYEEVYSKRGEFLKKYYYPHVPDNRRYYANPLTDNILSPELKNQYKDIIDHWVETKKEYDEILKDLKDYRYRDRYVKKESSIMKGLRK